MLSIIVPIYNSKEHINKCVNSILAQDFQNWELILVDDGSCDGSFQLCDTFASTDNRIRSIHKVNGGVSSARNLGIKVATGNYIMFCDSDDFVERTWCSTHLSAIQNNPYAFIVSGINRIDSEIVSTNFKDINSAGQLSYFDIFKLGLSPYTVNKIYNANIIREFNIQFDESFDLGEDVIFNVDYYKHCSDVILIQQSLYNYVNIENSATNKYQYNLFEKNLPLFSARLPLINKNIVSEFCDIYFNYFINFLNNTMDPRNKMSFFKKLRYNNKMIKSKEFKYCVANISGHTDSKLFIRIVRMHNYYIYWLFQKICSFKDKLSRK